MIKVVRQSEATVRQVAENKTAYNFITKDITPEVSLTVIEGKNYNAPITAEQNWIYYVIDGEMLLEFNENNVKLSTGDACYITKGEHYLMRGTYKSIIVCQPA